MQQPLSGLSVYRQLADVLRDRIETGSYERGRQLPSELDLAAEFGVSRVTVNRALRELQNEGLLTVRRGVGVFVNSPAEIVDVQDLLEYIEGRLNAGDVLLFRRQDGAIDRVLVTKTERSK